MLSKYYLNHCINDIPSSILTKSIFIQCSRCYRNFLFTNDLPDVAIWNISHSVETSEK